MQNLRKLDFTGNHFYIGIDVHKNQWTICIRSNQMKIAGFCMNPSPTELQKHLQTHYPGGTYHSVYEAGYSGFWIHRKLNALGIHNIVINPADVPTTDKERRHKNDSWDAQKLSRELNNDSLKAIYVPNEFHESIRALSRLRERVVSHQTRLKNRIKAFLSINGINLPPNSECQHWSKRFMTMLESLELHTPAAKEALAFSLEELQQTRQRLVTLTRRLRHHIQNHDDNWIVEQLLKVPGVGFITASTFYTEVMDINRFRNNDALNSFTGLAPSTHSSGDTDKDTGITPRRNRRLRHMMIEAAWTAVRKDPALLLYFNNLLLRMPKQKAIVRVAKKLTNRMRHVWRTKQPYVTCVVE